MEPHGQARGPRQPYSPPPTLQWVIRWLAKSAEAQQVGRSNHCCQSHAFLHGQGRGLPRRRMNFSSMLRGDVNAPHYYNHFAITLPNTNTLKVIGACGDSSWKVVRKYVEEYLISGMLLILAVSGVKLLARFPEE
jgi:hypothetical protein